MKRMIAGLLCLLLLPLVAAAQTGIPPLRERPLAYVPADSVALEDFFWTRAYGEVKEMDSTWRPIPVTVDMRDRKRFGKEAAAWNRMVEQRLSLVGSLTDERPDETTRHALQVLEQSARLFLLTGDARYADVVERALYNGVRAGILPCEKPAVRKQAAHAVLNATGLIYAAEGVDVYVNLYCQSQAIVSTDSLNMVIMQSTSSPWMANTLFYVRFSRPEQRMRLHLRIPLWMRGQVLPEGDRYSFVRTREIYRLAVNGQMVDVPVENGYVVIDRVWKADDALNLSMQMPVRRILQSDDAGVIALQRGPLAYVWQAPWTEFALGENTPVGYQFAHEERRAEILQGKFTEVAGSMEQEARPEQNFEAVPYYIGRMEKPDSCFFWMKRLP